METVKQRAVKAYDALDGIFPPKDAWGLYKAAAWLESTGWVLLIIGIVAKTAHLPGHDFLLPVGGSIHGLFFIFYVLIVLFAHRSMKWSFAQFVIAEVLGNIPFGAVAFEQYIIRKKGSRNNHA